LAGSRGSRVNPEIVAPILEETPLGIGVDELQGALVGSVRLAIA
jgi:hypothetical protein